jgi:hypothetical protein
MHIGDTDATDSDTHILVLIDDFVYRLLESTEHSQQRQE